MKPAVGHISTNGFWHPSRSPEGCPKCPPKPVTQADIDSAQQELDDVIESAKAQGKTFRTSSEWAAALSNVASLRRRFEREQELSRPDPGSRGLPAFLHSVKD